MEKGELDNKKRDIRNFFAVKPKVIGNKDPLDKQANSEQPLIDTPVSTKPLKRPTKIQCEQTFKKSSKRKVSPVDHDTLSPKKLFTESMYANNNQFHLVNSNFQNGASPLTQKSPMHSYTTPPQTIQYPTMLPYVNMPNGAALGTPGMSQMSDQTTYQQQPTNNMTDQSTLSRQPANNLPPLADISQLKQGTAEYQFAAARNIYQTGYAAMLDSVKNKDKLDQLLEINKFTAVSKIGDMQNLQQLAASHDQTLQKVTEHDTQIKTLITQVGKANEGVRILQQRHSNNLTDTQGMIIFLHNIRTQVETANKRVIISGIEGNNKGEIWRNVENMFNGLYNLRTPGAAPPRYNIEVKAQKGKNKPLIQCTFQEEGIGDILTISKGLSQLYPHPNIPDRSTVFINPDIPPKYRGWHRRFVQLSHDIKEMVGGFTRIRIRSDTLAMVLSVRNTKEEDFRALYTYTPTYKPNKDSPPPMKYHAREEDAMNRIIFFRPAENCPSFDVDYIKSTITSKLPEELITQIDLQWDRTGLQPPFQGLNTKNGAPASAFYIPFNSVNAAESAFLELAKAQISNFLKVSLYGKIFRKKISQDGQNDMNIN